MKKLTFVAYVVVAASATLSAFAGSGDFVVTVNGARADLVFDAGNYAKNSSLRVNDDLFTTGVSSNPLNYYHTAASGFNHNQKAQIGFTRANQYIASLRIYDRVLTAAERTANYKVDRARFLVPVPRDVSPYTVVHAGTNLIFR